MNLIPHNKPTLAIEEQTACSEVFASGMLASSKQIEKFEDEICQFLGLPLGHAVATSSGSAALLVALKVLDSQNVAMPSYVCQSLKQASLLAGADADIIDIDQYSTNICQTKLSESTADTLIYPYLYGQASQLPKFSGLIIEDIAQALGAKLDGKMLGTIGDCGVLSFYATKLITSGGQGGMLVSKNKKVIDDARNFLNFDMPTDNKAHFNLPITELQAAIGRVQLGKLHQFIGHREKIWQIYYQAGLPLLTPTKSDIHKLNSVRYRAVIMTEKAKELIRFLTTKKIKAIIPIESWELLAPTENAMALANKTVSLPIYPSLTLEQASFIAELCSSFLNSEC